MRPLRILSLTAGVLIGALLYQNSVGEAQAQMSRPGAIPTLVYVGTYTGEKSKGIYVFSLRTSGNEVSQNITLVPMGLAAETPNPSFIELDVKRRLLFAVNEVDEFQGKPTGSVSAFSIEQKTGKLTLINQVASGGRGPCHLILDKEGKNLLVANYSSGTVAVVPVATDGRLGEATSVIQHTGRSVHPEIQKGPHAHGVALDAANQFAFVTDLGLDKVMIYKFDAKQGKLTPNEPPFAKLKPGAGPRHIEFRPDGRFAYVLNEMDSTVTAYSYDAAKGALTEVQTTTTLPGYYEGPNTTAELGIHPNGNYLYASNRGHNSVVLFNIDKDKGTLEYVEEQGTGGKTPRHFGIQPSGQHMAIGNQNSDTVLASRIDAGNGRLKPSGIFADVGSPACMKFLPPPEPAK